MNNGRTIFSQLIEYLPNKEFQKCVSRYRGDHYVKKFSCWDQFLSMAFAQLTYRDGLRDIESCLIGSAEKQIPRSDTPRGHGMVIIRDSTGRRQAESDVHWHAGQACGPRQKTIRQSGSVHITAS